MDKQLAQQLSEIKTQISSITAAIALLDQKVSEPESEPELPLWLKLAADDSVPLIKVLKAAQIWDQQDFDDWCQEWNKTKHKRVQLLREAIQTWKSDLMNHTMQPITLNVRDVKDAESIFTQMKTYEATKAQVLQLIQSYDYHVLESICSGDQSNNFQLYYEWVNQFIKAVKDLLPVPEQETTCCDDVSKPYDLTTQLSKKIILIHERHVQTLGYLLNETDMLIIEPLRVINPQTFEEVLAPPHAQTAYKEQKLTNYKTDLRKAFEFINPNPTTMM